MSIPSVASGQANDLKNPVNAAHFSEIKARIELAVRQKAPQTPGTAETTAAPVMPGSSQAAQGPGRLLNAYA